jgi:N6-L-threonylcarbamoyladenine synthase
VRIGVATAKGLAQGLGAPLYGVGTLDAIAWQLAEFEGTVAVVGDAMRGEVYPALFRAGGGVVERLTADTVAKPVDVATSWAAMLTGPVLLTGNGLAKYADVFSDALPEAGLAERSDWYPSGRGLLAAFEAERMSGELAAAIRGGASGLHEALGRRGDRTGSRRTTAGVAARKRGRGGRTRTKGPRDRDSPDARR